MRLKHGWTHLCKPDHRAAEQLNSNENHQEVEGHKEGQET